MKRAAAILAVGILVMALLLGCHRAWRPSGPIRLVTREVSLGKIPPGVEKTQITASWDGKRVAYVAGNRVVVDGVKGKEYDRIGQVVFSPDSKRLAYAAERRGKWVAVVDGVEGPEYDRIGYTLLPPPGSGGFFGWGPGVPAPFSPDSKRLAYAAERRGKWVVVVDGVEGKEYDGIREGDPIFSPDSRRVVYAALRGGQWLVVVDGVEGKEYDRIGDLALSSDGRRVAYAATRDGKSFVVVSGVEDKKYDMISDVLLSPDGKRLAYVAWRKPYQLLVVDGVEGKEYHQAWGPVFSPDGTRVAYWARAGRKPLVVVDGVEREAIWDRGPPILFSPDSRHVAYVTHRQNENWPNLMVVVDGVDFAEGDYFPPPAFSPDSRHLAYGTRRDSKWTIAIDGVKEKGYYDLISRTLVFDGPRSLPTVVLRGNEVFRVEIEIVE